MNDNYNYPVGSDTEDAPWNDNLQEAKETKVMIFITLCKEVTVKVDDYTSEDNIDEEGNHYTEYNFSDCDFKSAVRNQIILPNEIDEFKDWKEDNLEIISEEEYKNL